LPWSLRDTGPDGWITGEIRGVPSAREGKVTAWNSGWRRGPGLGGCGRTFYSDSVNDLPLLEVAHPVATNPDDRLRALAKAAAGAYSTCFLT
jgi:phosphoserine phosphatase